MSDRIPRPLALIASGAAVGFIAALIFSSELESGSDETGATLILIGFLTPLTLAFSLRLVHGSPSLVRDAVTTALGFALVMGATAAVQRTIDASRPYNFFVVFGYFTVVLGALPVLGVAGVQWLVRSARRNSTLR